MDMPWKKGTSFNKMSFSTSDNAFACCAVFLFAFAASLSARPATAKLTSVRTPASGSACARLSSSAISASDTGSTDVLNSASAAAARVRCQASSVSLKSMRMAVAGVGIEMSQVCFASDSRGADGWEPSGSNSGPTRAAVCGAVSDSRASAALARTSGCELRSECAMVLTAAGSRTVANR